MRILKYILLLSLLVLFAATVFISTQSGHFDVEKSAVIKSPRSTVFNYVNDYLNWGTFASWKQEDPKMEFYYSKNTVGKGGSYSWKGNDGEGNIKTLTVNENQALHQKMNFNGSESDVYWTFKDTIGGTKITWRSKGKMGFGFKIYSVFQGGADKVIGSMYEKSLANLDKTLDYELNTYKIKVDGVVQKTGSFYLMQTITSKISNVPKNLRIMIPRIVNFFKKNNVPMNGRPFVLYHTYDVANDLTRLSVCIPLREEIFIRDGSDVSVGLLYPFQAVKTTLTGDYSHNREAWNKTFDYIAAKHLTQNKAGDYLEIYTKSIDQVANPSQWITEIYIPVQQPKAAVASSPKSVTPKNVVPAPSVAPEAQTEPAVP